MPFADLTDSRCYFEIEGAGDPLVLVPGLGRDGTCWDLAVDELAQHFTVIRPDNRGIGRSVPKRKPRRVRDYAADLVELLDHLQVDQAHVLGLSLGGIITQRFAVDHPSRVSRLVLVSCAQGFGPYLRQMAGVIGRGLTFPPKPSMLRAVELFGASPGYIDANPNWLDEKLRGLRRSRISGRAVLGQLRALSASRFEPDEYRIEAPTLVVAGEFDALIPHCYARLMADLIPGSTCVVLPGVGHNPVTEAPEYLLPLVTRFLQGGRVAAPTRKPSRKELRLNRLAHTAPLPLPINSGGPA